MSVAEENRAALTRAFHDLEMVLADGDHVVVLARGDTMTTEGQRYNNDYCFVFRLEAGKIVSVREYLDTKLADAVLGTG